MVAPGPRSDQESVDEARLAHTTSDTPLPRQLRPPWETAERLSGALVASMGLLLVAGVGAGMAAGLSASNDLFSSEKSALSRELISATTWAGISVVLVFYVALGLVWWNATGWVAVLDQWRPTPDTPRGAHAAQDSAETFDEDDVLDAFGHLQRARWLARLIGLGLVVTALAAVGYAVGDTINLGGSSVTVAPLIVLWGAVAALTVLVGAGLVAVRVLRQQCRRALEFDDDEVESDDGLRSPAPSSEA